MHLIFIINLNELNIKYSLIMGLAVRQRRENWLLAAVDRFYAIFAKSVQCSQLTCIRYVDVFALSILK